MPTRPPTAPPRRIAATLHLLGAPARRLDAAPRALVAGLLLAFFAAAHFLYHRLGFTLDVGTLATAYQFLDPNLLRGDLLRSLLYQHSQPPAYNAYLGGMLKLQPERYVDALHAGNVAFAFALFYAVYALLRGFRVRRALSVPLACGFLVSPAVVLYEHWLFYQLPVAALLALAALSLQRFLRSGRLRAALAFCAALLVVSSSWSAFHLVFFLGALAVAFAAGDRRRRVTLLKAAALPTALLLALYLKNYVLFDSFAASSWMGMSFAKVTLAFAPRRELQALVRADRISPLALQRSYSVLTSYPAKYREAGRFQAIPALSALRKYNGQPNFNHVGFVAVSSQYMRDIRQVLVARPRTLWEGVQGSLALYALPSGDYVHLDLNRKHFARYDELFNRLVLLRVERPRPIHLSIVVGLPFLFLFGLLRARRAASRAERGTLVFVVVTVAYATVAFNVLEYGENNRFRFVLEPLFVVLLGLFLQRAGSWVTRLSR